MEYIHGKEREEGGNAGKSEGETILSFSGSRRVVLCWFGRGKQPSLLLLCILFSGLGT
jgi:hypothetical protein